MTTRELAILVDRMRKAQKTFFMEARRGNKSAKDAALEESKKLEREVDQAVFAILNPVNDDQIKLF